VLHGIAMGGINSASINLIYDYVDRNKRTSALALKNTLAGFAGFFTTLAVSPLVAFIQESGNKFLGLNVYAQQVTSCISMILLIVLVVYINLVVKKLKPTNH
jgi:MFS family permease